jgi:hypothetical protein
MIGRRTAFCLAAATTAQLLVAPAGHAQSPPPPESPPKPTAAIASLPSDAPSPDEEDEAETAEPRGPTVVLRANHPEARLQVQTQLRWRTICAAPCAERLDVEGVYRVAGSSLRPSQTFALPRASGVVRIDAELGSERKHDVGIVLIVVGIAAGALALYLFHPWSTTQSFGTSEPVSQTKDNGYINGLVSLATAFGLSTAGIALLATSGTTVNVR